MAGAVKETGTDCPSRTSEFIPVFGGVCVAHFLSFLRCVFPLRPVYCTVSFTGSSFRIVPSSCVLYCQWIVPSSCVLYCQFHWIVHSGLPFRPVYCTVSFTGLSIRDCPFVLCIVLSVSLDRPFGIAPSSCVLYCQFYLIVHSGLPLRPEYCTVSFTGSSIRDCPFVLCIVLSVSLDRPFEFTPSSYVLYCQFHWIVHSGLPLRPVYCTVSFTGSSFRDWPFVLCIVLSVSLDCPFGIAPSSCVLYCQAQWIVHSGLPLRPVYCTVSFTGSSIRDSLSDFANVYILFSLTLKCDLLPRYHVNLNGYIIYRFIKIHKRDVLILC